MNKYIIVLFFSCFCLTLFGQKSDAEVITSSDRSIQKAYRMALRPTMIDTTINTSVTKYPLLSVHEKTSIVVDSLSAASIRMRPQLSQLYRGYAKVGMGSRLQPLGEIYFNSLRDRRFNWGIHGKHHSEWGKLKEYAPSQYDNSSLKAFGKVEERRFSYGGEAHYQNDGLHYYGFRNPNADKDSIRQRFQDVGFSAFFDSHVKDSAKLKYRIGVEYDHFSDRKPDEKEVKDWNGRENYVGLKTKWEYNGLSQRLLSNLRADLNVAYNGYRYGDIDSSLTLLDTGIVTDNVVAQLRPVASFYGTDHRLKFKVGGEIAMGHVNETQFSIYPIAEVKYSLFNDIFIPYAGITGGLQQQRFQKLAYQNEFIRSNQEMRNERKYDFYVGFKGSLSSRITFNAQATFSKWTDHALFVSDTTYSAGNQFEVIYDTLEKATISASISYQDDEKLKIDLIGRYNFMRAYENAYVWNTPELEVILRGKYNVADRLITNIDFTLETGRKAKVFDEGISGVKEQDGTLYKDLGVLADVNLGVEFRYSKRLSIFANLNNIAAQNYKRWHDYPVNAFQAMLGFTFRF